MLKLSLVTKWFIWPALHEALSNKYRAGENPWRAYPSGPFKVVSGGTALVISQVPSVPQPKSKPAMFVPKNWNLPPVLFCLGTRTRGKVAADDRPVKTRRAREEYIFTKKD